MQPILLCKILNQGRSCLFNAVSECYTIENRKEKARMEVTTMDINTLRQMPFYLTDSEISRITSTLASMSDREKCGQLFMVLGNANSDEGLKELITDWGVGGVLFRPAPADVVKEQYERASSYAKIPLLKAANLEEGGAGVLSDGTYFGNALGIAAADDLSCTEAFAACCAAEGRSVGVSWTFSPVVDIDMNPLNPITNVRTFGSNADRVLENSRVFVRTLQQYGVAASCKHFPGDGVDYRDQHLHPTYNSLSAEDWFDTYGRIYKELISEGLMSVMVGHIVQPSVIREINPLAQAADMLPGSLSYEMMTGVLRERFGFNGLIITDATIMGGYTMPMSRRDAIPHSIMAGADMLCFGTDIREDITYLYDALLDGRLTAERLDEAVLRVLALKAVVSRDYPMPSSDHKAASADCARKAVTLVKNNDSIIPVTAEKHPSIKLVILGKDAVYDCKMSELAASYLRERGFSVERYDPFEDDLHGTSGLQSDRLTLILCNYPTASNQTDVRIHWCEKHALEIPRFVNEEPTVFISFSNPYHLQDIPRVRTFINAYSATRATIEAALSCLTGEQEFKGVSPVDSFCGLEDTRL